jgi:TPR repeat protein
MNNSLKRVKGVIHRRGAISASVCSGDGVRKDYADAARLYRWAAEHGHADARAERKNIRKNIRNP